MIGDGYTEVIRCENYEGDISDIEPDANPLECPEEKPVSHPVN